ncbi:MAG: HAD-IA family hydrolase [Dehalococcoidia bacterium]|nr:HAD-IA family hydrolase [Dehalococcoidia bacterium]
MIKVVCFDFFNTLAYFDPPRDKFYAKVAGDFGVKVTPEAIEKALPEADSYWRLENFKSPIRTREDNDKYPVYTQYALRILKGATPPATPEQALQILAKAFSVGFKFVAFQDSLPALSDLKNRKLTVGVISNIGQEIDSYCSELGFEPYLDFKVTSFEVGYDKPRPEIFQLALKKAGCSPEEAVFVGDQYEQDILGARGVGMKPVLIDRKKSGNNPDCQVIDSLLSIPGLI